jgi:Mis12-Mtw1 protein family
MLTATKTLQTGIKDTVVALPVSDTPIIRRNQDLRQQANGRRRSSLGLRGNRTSSIGNGFEGTDLPTRRTNPQRYRIQMSRTRTFTNTLKLIFPNPCE